MLLALLRKSIQLTNYSKGYKIDKVNNGEIYISPSLYNKWFGTEYTYNDSDKIIQYEVRIRVKEVTYNNEISIPKDRTFKIAGLVNKGTEMILLSEDDFLYMGTSIVYPHTAYFDNIDSITKAYVPNSLKLEPFYCENEYYEAAYEMNEVVGMFNEVFLLIFLALIFICIIILCGFCFRMIKRKKYDVGVYKAIGGRLSQFRRFFTIQLLFVFLLIAIFSTTLVFTLAKPLNDILVNTLIKHNKLIALKYIVLIKPDIYGMSIIYLFVFILLMITYVWSLDTFKRVKPINIIRDLK